MLIAIQRRRWLRPALLIGVLLTGAGCKSGEKPTATKPTAPTTTPQTPPSPTSACYPDASFVLADRVVMQKATDLTADRNLDEQYLSIRVVPQIGESSINDSDRLSVGRRLLNAVFGSDAQGASVITTMPVKPGGLQLPVFSVVRGVTRADGSIDANQFQLDSMPGELILPKGLYPNGVKLNLRLANDSKFDSKVFKRVTDLAKAISVPLGGVAAMPFVTGAIVEADKYSGSLDTELSNAFTTSAKFNYPLTLCPEDLKRLSGFSIVFYERLPAIPANEIVRARFIIDTHHSMFGETETNSAKLKSDPSPARILGSRITADQRSESTTGSVGQQLQIYSDDRHADRGAAQTDITKWKSYCGSIEKSVNTFEVNWTDRAYILWASLALVGPAKNNPEDRGCPDSSYLSKFTDLGKRLAVAGANERLYTQLSVATAPVLALKAPGIETSIQMGGETKKILGIFDGNMMPNPTFEQGVQFYPGIKQDEPVPMTAKEFDELYKKRPAKTVGYWSDRETKEGNYWVKTFYMDFDKENTPRDLCPVVGQVFFKMDYDIRTETTTPKIEKVVLQRRAGL